MAYYVLLRGPLGVGKSTIARALARRIGATLVSIDAIVDPEWDGGSLGLYLRANARASEVARRALADGRPVVFDGCFYWKTQIRDLERRLRFPHRVFTLRAPLSVCVERDAKRRGVHGATAVEEVYRKTMRFRFGLPVDATRRVADTVRGIRARLPVRGRTSLPRPRGRALRRTRGRPQAPSARTPRTGTSA